jgi:hypothetical protein
LSDPLPLWVTITRLPKHSWERDRERKGGGEGILNAILIQRALFMSPQSLCCSCERRGKTARGGGEEKEGWASVSQVARKSSRLQCFISFSLSPSPILSPARLDRLHEVYARKQLEEQRKEERNPLNSSPAQMRQLGAFQKKKFVQRRPKQELFFPSSTHNVLLLPLLRGTGICTSVAPVCRRLLWERLEVSETTFQLIVD